MEEYEICRQKLKSALYKSIIITVVFALLGLFFIPAFNGFIISGVFGAIISSSVYIKAKRQFREVYKNNFVMSVLQKNLDDVTYVPKQGFPEKVLASTGMIRTGDVYKTEDYISATYNNVRFEQADVHIQEQHSNGKSTYYVTIFKGRWVILNFNKEFKSNFIVYSKNFRVARTGSFLGIQFGSKKKVELESQSFNKMFNVYAQDDYDVFYILTPAMMEKFIELHSSFGNMAFVFYNNMLYIGIDNRKDSFEPVGELYKVETAYLEEKIVDEIRPIMELINVLELENDLYK